MTFLSNRRLLVRQAIWAWIILFVGVIRMATIATFLTIRGLSNAQSTVVSLVIVGGLAVIAHIFLHGHNYRVFGAKKRIDLQPKTVGIAPGRAHASPRGMGGETLLNQRLCELSAEALVAVSGLEQALLLAELRRTDILKGLSEEQILALAAEKSPAVLRAFQERFEALSVEDQRIVYEQLARAQQASADGQDHPWREAVDTLAKLFAESNKRSVRVLFCRVCGTDLPAEARFCPRCGMRVSAGEE